MPRKIKPPPFSLAAPVASPKPPPPAQLPLKATPGVRLTLEGSDLAAVEAAAAELKARFGTRFAVTGRRLASGQASLRISASLVTGLDNALDAENGRQADLFEASHAA